MNIPKISTSLIFRFDISPIKPVRFHTVIIASLYFSIITLDSYFLNDLITIAQEGRGVFIILNYTYPLIILSMANISEYIIDIIHSLLILYPLCGYISLSEYLFILCVSNDGSIIIVYVHAPIIGEYMHTSPQGISVSISLWVYIHCPSVCVC